MFTDISANRLNSGAKIKREKSEATNAAAAIRILFFPAPESLFERSKIK